MTHAITTIREMCDRVAWIDEGRVREIGPPNIVCSHYEKELAESYTVIKELAESGVSAAQNTLGCMYRDGNRTEKNLESALFWFEKASDGGDTDANVNLANMIFENNKEKAIDLYADAATKDNKEAKAKLSRLLIEDASYLVEEVKKDYEKLLLENTDLYFDYADLLLKTALTDSDYVNSFNWFLKTADKGNINGMFQVAIMHRDGVGTRQNTDNYIFWLKKAADCGHVQSQFLLGNMYRDGIKVEGSMQKAFKWYLRAAENNHLDAMYQTAMMYRKGIGVAENRNESDKFLKFYYRSRIIKQIKTIADSYSHSKNGVADIERGLKWYSLGAELGDAESIYQKAMLMLNFKNNTELDFLLNSAIAKGHFGAIRTAVDMIATKTINEKTGEFALSYLEKFSNEGNPLASNYLGNIYASGKIVEKNEKQALMYLTRATNQNLHVSMNKLGEMYRDGICVERNIEKSVYWFLRGIDAGSIPSAVSLINLYGTGTIEFSICERALNGLEKMSLSGNVHAMRILGTVYYEGKGINIDYQKAIYWFSAASKAGDLMSEHYLGEIYFEGKGVEEDKKRALNHLLSAADCGNISSLLYLIKMKDCTMKKHAIKKLEMLALGGNITAARNLGILSLQGKYISEDKNAAEKWFTIGSNLGDIFSKNKLISLQNSLNKL